MNFITIFTILSLFTLSFSEENLNHHHHNHVLPRPLIIEKYTENAQLKETLEEVRLECTSWRFAVEANNLSPWKTIPEECADYVKEYMTGKGYKIELDRVAKEARVYANNVELSGEGNDVWVFDVDETLLSNLPYYEQHGYGYNYLSQLSSIFHIHLISCKFSMIDIHLCSSSADLRELVEFLTPFGSENYFFNYVKSSGNINVVFRSKVRYFDKYINYCPLSLVPTYTI